ncbi:LysM peptidoglycan-binding domain-containing protein [Clostridium sp.]|jgi:LysM repeat protein|uniref:LysM peptidoglycan-binding domain-containing protein n=1 Tax=Clostridium sp. TaxID=1506 RepID=UPI00258DB83D|nr:LysM peptidoglycan-binding domain-containing protein [Clostridium sp.]MDF2505691.1 LysM protein [Clostridium sp.]
MSRNKLLLILSSILVLLICSSLVYNDQQNSISLKPSYNIINDSSSKSKPTFSEESNKNIVKVKTDTLDYIYINYKVKSGDDLYSLSKNFMPTYLTAGVVKEIKEKNNLRDDKIQANIVLKIPAEKTIINKK